MPTKGTNQEKYGSDIDFMCIHLYLCSIIEIYLVLSWTNVQRQKNVNTIISYLREMECMSDNSLCSNNIVLGDLNKVEFQAKE